MWYRGGDTRSSDEVTVMVMEQRGVIIQLEVDNNWKQEDLMQESKPYNIPKNERMQACLLELQPEKTRIVYCKDKDRKKEYPITEFDFLGYTFKGIFIKNRSGGTGVNFIASASKNSNKAFREKVKTLEIHRKAGCKIDMIAEVKKRKPDLFAHWQYRNRSVVMS